jgi:hypothetical protein
MVVSILRRTLRRLGRRGPDQESTSAVIDMLTKRGVSGRPAADPNSVTQELSLAQGSRTLAVVRLDSDQAPLTYVIATRIGGEAAGHLGRITVTGLHVTLDRRSLPERWPSNWDTPVQAQPSEGRVDYGESRSFVWRPVNATGAGVREVVQLLGENERVAQWVGGVLREQSTMQFEVAPTSSMVRVAAHQGGSGLPHPTTVEAVLTVARAIAET